jgi:3-oxoacyl-[acyl-carrier protein] reductase
MDLDIKGKVALVMGSSDGIGKAVAQSLLDEGVKVALCSRSLERVTKTKEEIGAHLALEGDLTKVGVGKSLVNEVKEKLGSVDILVCNTGGPPKGDFFQINEEQWQESFQALWMSVVESLQTCLPWMQEKKWGRVVLVTSIAAKEALPGLTISNGLRAGLMGLTRSLAHEVACDGITINSVLPGLTDTQRLRDLYDNYDDLEKTVPANRIGKAQEVASLVTFLASNQASYVNSQHIACDGARLKGNF